MANVNHASASATGRVGASMGDRAEILQSRYAALKLTLVNTQSL
jgi:hypothetical protein